MSFSFNPLIFAGLDLTGGGAAGAVTWREAVANEAALPLAGNAPGEARVTLDSDKIYVWDQTSSRWVDTGVTSAAFGSSPNTSGQTIGIDDTTSGIRRRTLVLQPADATNPGGVSITTQSFAGAKTFLDSIKIDESSNQILLGTTTTTALNAPNPTSNRVVTIPDAGIDSNIVLTESNQSINGTKTFSSTINANLGVDVAATAGIDTLTIGGNNADVVNIGHSGTVVNIIGTTFNQQVTNVNVEDKNVSLNVNGAVGSGATAGFGVEEGGSITGYVEVSGDRNSWSLKAPNTAGVATITPGAVGITINQSSHDPTTLGSVGSAPNASGASLSGQQLTLQPADATNPGLLTAGTQTIGGNKTFTGTVSASNLSGTNTGDVTLAAVGVSSNSNGATIVGQQLNLEPASAAFPGVVTTGTQTLSGAKTFSSLLTAQASIALTGHISTADYIDFTSAVAPAYNTGRVFYDSDNDSLSYSTNISGIAVHPGRENVLRVRNTSGAIITKGKAVYVSGSTTQTPSIALARADSLATCQVIGVVQQDVAINGYTDIVTFGVIQELDTGAFTDGQTVYLSAVTAGELTATPPSSPNYQVEVGVITYAQNVHGKILINPSTPKLIALGDVAQNVWLGLANNTANQSIVGLSFVAATTRAFHADISIAVDATSDLFAKYAIEGIRKNGTWEVSTEFTGDLITGISFDVTAAGQVRVSIGNITGFSSGSVHFRAEALSI